MRDSLRFFVLPVLSILFLFPLGASAQPFTVAGPLTGVQLNRLTVDVPAGITGISRPPGNDDRLFLTLRDGRIVILENGAVLPRPFLDIRSLVGLDGEGGLFATAFHPRYAQNGLFFVHYTNRSGDTRLARYRVSGNRNVADAGSGEILLSVDQPFSNHNGGQIEFGPDGFLYMGLGDGGSGGDPFCNAQRGDTLLGKILRLDVDNRPAGQGYGIPPTNPFVTGVPYPRETWAVGVRNPWKFSFDPATGDLYIGDVGQNDREEVNLEPAGGPGGRNYGWKIMEGSRCFGTDSCPVGTPSCNAASLTLPILEYTHAGNNCSVTGGVVYRSAQSPNGVYLFGDLCSGRIWGAHREANRWVVRELGERVSQLTAFGLDRNGAVYLGTIDGRLYRLEGTGGGGTVASRTGVGVYNPARSQFQLRNTATAGPADRRFDFGRPNGGWTPVAGDWNGDGVDTVGFYDSKLAVFRLRNSFSSGASDLLFGFGTRNNRKLPVIGNWDGQGTDGVGLYDPASATFELKNALGQGPAGDLIRVTFGGAAPGWKPVAGDWDGDGDDEVGLYDPARKEFHLRASLAANAPVEVIPFSAAGANAVPLAGDWLGSGNDTVGVYDPATARFTTLCDICSPPFASFVLGRPRWIPLAGKWQGR